LTTHLAGVVVQGCHAHECCDAAPVEFAEFGQLGQQHGHAGRADTRHAGQRLRQLSVMALDMCSHLDFAVSLLLLEELDHALDAWARGRMRQAQALSL